jgi:hypothetical protein
MELRIDHQFPQVGIMTQRASIEYDSVRPQIQLKREPSVLRIESPRPVIHIDQSQCFADAGLKSPLRWADDRAAAGKEGLLKAIAEISAKGDQLMRFTRVSIADLAEPMGGEMHEYDVKAIPQQPPEISFDISPVKFNYQPAKINISVRRGQLNPHFRPGTIEIYENQKAYLKISWVGNNYDQVA